MRSVRAVPPTNPYGWTRIERSDGDVEWWVDGYRCCGYSDEFEDCIRRCRTRGFCAAHYRRLLLNGTPLLADDRTPRGQPERFFEEAMLLITDDCIIWPYAATPYGKLNIDGIVHNVPALACERIYGPPPSPMHIATHGPCHEPRCFNARGGHVTWETWEKNAADRLRDGTSNRGERHPDAKLTEADVREIRERYAQGGISQHRLGTVYGVTQGAIQNVVERKTWKHVL